MENFTFCVALGNWFTELNIGFQWQEEDDASGSYLNKFLPLYEIPCKVAYFLELSYQFTMSSSSKNTKFPRSCLPTVWLNQRTIFNHGDIILFCQTEAAVQGCSYKKLFWKYALYLQENTHAEVRFQNNFNEITLWYGCYPGNLLHIFRTPFPKNISGWLLLTRGNP